MVRQKQATFDSTMIGPNEREDNLGEDLVEFCYSVSNPDILLQNKTNNASD